MKICLIFTPAEHMALTADWAFRDDGVGVIPPLSLMYVAGILEKIGVEVKIIDMIASRFTLNQALAEIEQFSPDMLGFTLSTYSFHPILKWIKNFKDNTGLPILVGGAHVMLYPIETMSHQTIDYAIVGEAEKPLPEFIHALESGKSLHGIKSLCFRDEGKLVADLTRQTLDNIDEIPYPSRNLIDNTKYRNILSRNSNFTAMMSTRGCPYRCTFCDQKTPPYRLRTAKNFVEEIKFNYHTFGIKEFDVYDSTFTANRSRVIEICNLLAKENLDIGWSIRSTIMAVNHEVLDALKLGGCHTIMYGVESSNQEILALMKKKISSERVWERINYTSKIGIRVLGFFMFGYPGETRQTIEDTIRLSLQLPLDYAQYTVLIPFPDTEIYEYYQNNSDCGDYWGKYTLDPANEINIDLLGTEINREEASKLLAKAYHRFYFRPRIIWARFRQLSSKEEFLQLSKGAIGLLKNFFKNRNL
ncbi:MAG: radical SAM protein [Magnetococcales bacterium]|nr:radical SAM protein [Magnetococcales bacterium]